MTSALISIHATILLCLAVFLSTARGFYLPGVAPHDFYTGEPVELKVNKLRYAHVTHSSSSRRHPLFSCNIYIYHTYSSDPPKIPYWSIHLLTHMVYVCLIILLFILIFSYHVARYTLSFLMIITP